MDLLASIIAYMGAVAGIVVAIALSYNSLMLYGSREPQAATSVAARSNAPAMPKPKAMRKADIGRAALHVNRSFADDAKSRTAAPQRLNRTKQRPRRLANDWSRRRLAHGLRALPKEWAYRPVPGAPNALGYAEGPRAPFGN